MRNVPALLVTASLILACSSSKAPPPPPPAGCDLLDGTCVSGAGMSEAICTNDWVGAFLPDGCPAPADRIGVCSVPDLIVPGSSGTIVFYASGWTVADAVDACLFEGGEYDVACAPGGEVAYDVACNFAGDMCDQIAADLNDCQLDTLSVACTSGGGSFAANAACSTTGTVAGYCRLGEAATSEITGIPIPGGTMYEYYYTANWTVDEAHAFCATPPAGTWMY